MITTWKHLNKLITPLKDDNMFEYLKLVVKPFNIMETTVGLSAILSGIITSLAMFSEDYLGISGRFAFVLLFVIFADWLTGTLAAVVKGEETTSKKGLKTVYKTGAYLIFIYTAFALRFELEGDAPLFEEVLRYFHIFLMVHIIFWELFSIDENFQKLGVNLGITTILKNTYNTIANLFKNVSKKE